MSCEICLISEIDMLRQSDKSIYKDTVLIHFKVVRTFEGGCPRNVIFVRLFATDLLAGVENCP